MSSYSSTGMTVCPQCKLPRFYGVFGYAGPTCMCAWEYRMQLDFPPEQPASCGCRGPQNGEPLCPCAMRGVVIKNGRYVKPEQDLGPAPSKPAEPRWGDPIGDLIHASRQSRLE